MALGEEGCWVPPFRKFSGVPSLATFRRTALTPWNSQDSSSGTGSPPESPRHALFKDTSKDKKNQGKDPVETNTRLAPLSALSNEATPKPTADKEDDGLRIDRIFKMNSKNQLDRRRIKSSEPLGERGKNPNLKSATRTDGRDSLRLKNKGKFRKTDSKQISRNPKSTGETSCQIKVESSKQQVGIPSDNLLKNNETNDNNKNPIIEVTESSNDLNTNGEVNCDNQRQTEGKSYRESLSELIPSDNEIASNINVKKRISLVNGYKAKSYRSGSLTSQRSLSPSSPINVNRTKNNSTESSRSSSRLGISKSISILEVQVIEPVEQNEDEQIIPVGFETNYNKKELEDDKDSSSSDSQDESDDGVKEEEKRKQEDVTSDDKADDADDTSSDDNDSDDSDDSDKKDEPDVGETDDKGDEGKNKTHALEVPTPKPQASPQQLLRIHGITLTKDKLKKLRSIVDKAAQRKKVFTIFGKYPSIREALVSRGWVQNFDLQKLSLPHTRQNDNEVSVYAKLRLGTGVGEEELALISRMLRDTPVHFVWIMGDTVDWKSLSKSTIVSRFPRVYFTTKVGLCSYLEESHWFCEASVSHVNFPRCYTTDDLGSFVRDFRLTACLGLIRTLIAAVDNNRPNIFSGKIPLSAIKFAVKRCSEFVSVEEHEDIDMDSEERVWDHQWDQFLTYYYQLVHEGETFVSANDDQIKALYSCCQAAVKGVKPYWPQLELDGLSNLWLVKPGAKSRGRGISVCNKIERIMAKLGSSNQPSTDINPPACSSRFVIQKYVERPLLIHNTKFDIRQWFLVTSAYPLTIWMYKESYLRFCSQLFSLSNLHESVHLTNNAVQCRYRNQNKRDKALPDENMWDSYTFQAYLRTLGRTEEWESVVYPGMRESITGALLAAQDHMEPRPNCFELYGADFILTEDLKPWLIEINSSPAMSATTSVTARMCPQCLEDIIKDRRSNRDAPTGQFELVYRQNVSTPQPYMGMNLTVRGSPAPRGKVPTPSWQPADGIQPTSHHTNIETALDSLADHLVSESDLLINSDERGGSSVAGEEGSKEASELLSRTAAGGRKRTERRCALYKKHSCMAPAHRNFSSLGFNNRSHRLYKKQMRINSVLLSMRRVSVAPTSDLLHWRQRVEHARALCSSAVARMTGEEEEDEAKVGKRTRTGWGRPRKSSRKKKAKDKDRTKSVDDIRVWNEENEDETKGTPSDNDNLKEKKTKTVIGLSRISNIHNEKPKTRSSLSSKGRLYQEWRGKSRFKNINAQEYTGTGGLTVEPIKDMEVTEDKVRLTKNKVSPGRSPRSLSPSVNIRGVGSPRAPRSPIVTRPYLSKCKANHVDRSPSPACRSLSPRISPLTPGFFDLSNTSTSLEPKHYLSPFAASDINNNWPVVQNHKYTFKSTSMINLPALLKTK